MAGRYDGSLELRKGSEAELAELRARAREWPQPRRPSAWGWLGARDELPDIFTLEPPTGSSPVGALLIAPRHEKAVGVIGAFMADSRVGSLWCALWVTPGRRREGIGRWALERVLAHCFGEFRFVKANMLVGGDDRVTQAFAASVGFCREVEIAVPTPTAWCSELVFGRVAAGVSLPCTEHPAASVHRRSEWPDVRLRRQQTGDVEWIVSELSEDDQRTTGAGLAWPESERERAAAWTFVECPETDSVGSWMVEFDGRPVGAVAATRFDPRTRTFWYGLWIASSVRRRGLGGAAVRALLRRMFVEYRCEKAFAGVASHNHASISMHGSLGFVREGVVRAAAFTGGRHWDEWVFGMDAERFRQAQTPSPNRSTGV